MHNDSMIDVNSFIFKTATNTRKLCILLKIIYLIGDPKSRIIINKDRRPRHDQKLKKLSTNANTTTKLHKMKRDFKTLYQSRRILLYIGSNRILVLFGFLLVQKYQLVVKKC